MLHTGSKHTDELVSCPSLDILRRGSNRLLGRSQVTLVERTYLALLESTDDAVEQASVMEEHHIFLLPVKTKAEYLNASN